MYADLVYLAQSSIKDYGLTEEQAAQLFIDIIGAIQWDLEEVDIHSDDWEEQERIAARKALGFTSK